MAATTPQTTHRLPAVRDLLRSNGLWLWLIVAAGSTLRLQQFIFNRSFWHDETLLVYNLACADGWTPVNQDGEVAGFVCLSAAQTLEQIQAGAFTQDAVASLAQGLGLL